MAAYYVKTLSDNLGYVTWIYYPAMGTLSCNLMFNNVLSIISVYGIRDCCNQIKYDYGRLVGISYLDHSENDMKYHYGATYDSWNRVRTMTYPDGEVVTYHYNAAGQVESLTSNKLGKNETLIEKIGYDKDGHTVYTKLGNGMESRYTYDKQRERLQEMTLSSAGNTVMQNKYKYDLVDNILGITNNADPQEIGNKNKAKLGGTFKHSYAYDDLNRLVYASGKAKQASYSMQMTFGRMSEPLTKVQKVDSTKTAQSYDFTYKYEDSNHPTAPTQIGHEHYTYDANGNPTLVENDWKAKGKPGDGYLMVEVDGVPYWTDAIGQIPYALNEYRNEFRKSKNSEFAAGRTLELGQQFGNGSLWNLLFPSPDTSNSYDNAMIKRAIDWAKNRYSLSPVRTSNGGYEIGVVRKDYSPANMRVYTIKKNKQ